MWSSSCHVYHLNDVLGGGLYMLFGFEPRAGHSEVPLCSDAGGVPVEIGKAHINR